MKRRDFLRRAAAAAGGTRALAALVPLRLLEPSAPFEETDVFVSGDGYPTYRIPSVLTTRRGTVLAVAEGRQGRGDHSENELVLRRSTDGGRTWGPLQRVAGDRPHVLVNPTLLEVSRSGRLWLMYQRFPHGFHEREVVPGYDGERICRSYLMHSDDDGRSWSEPRENTRSVKRPTEVTSVASGPGIGIELRHDAHRGRLVVPFNQGPWGAWKVYAVYSDDGGASWQFGETAPEASPGMGNEVQVVELTDGTLMLNVRSQGGSRRRKVALSRDGGHTWSGLVDDPELVEPECQATVVRYSHPADGQRSRILFANPASPTQRVNGTVRLSYDEGRTWPVSRTVYPGSFAYSCLTVLEDGGIGLLYERDDYGGITFARFDLGWLTDGRDPGRR
jgi:sialidase-1